MNNRNLTYIPYIIILLLFPALLFAQEGRTRIYGKIVDAGNKEPLPYVSIRISRTAIGCSSDNNGHFSFYAPALRDTLIVSCVGYAEERIILSPDLRMPVNVSLKPSDYLLSEIKIKPKKEKYRKKDNPAVTLARTIIKRRDDNSPKNKEYFSRDRHEKLNIALNNFNAENNSHFGKQFAFLEQYIDTSLISGEPILHISARELIATDYYRKEPERERQHVKGRKRNGIDDMFSTGEIEALYEETFKDIDIFQDNISLFGNKFMRERIR